MPRPEYNILWIGFAAGVAGYLIASAVGGMIRWTL